MNHGLPPRVPTTPAGGCGDGMSGAKSIVSVMDRVAAYRLSQAPFAERKLAPFFRHNRLESIHRVLDVGCGPGTNASHFQDVDYLGIDVNPDYIEYARRRYGGDRFRVADVTHGLSSSVGGVEGFDCILVNSLFHHIDTPGTRAVLAALSPLLTRAGHAHILDLVMPDRPTIARRLARWDRGEFPRPLEEWRALFGEVFEPVVFEPYPLGAFGVTLWNMVYFKGKRTP
jgi:SAM-dependent methyltransferase